MKTYAWTTLAAAFIAAPVWAMAGNREALGQSAKVSVGQAVEPVAVDRGKGAQSAGAPEGLRHAEMAALAKRLEAEAKDWLRSQGATPDNGIDLNAVVYDFKSLESLKDRLKVRRDDLVGLYVANRLLEPLMKAQPDLILAAMPFVKDVCQRLATYSDPPVYDLQTLAALQIPDYDARASPMELLQRLRAIDKAREQKRAYDMPVVLHNQQAYLLELNTVNLMVRSGDKRQDAELLTLLEWYEDQDSWTFADILEAIRAAAGKMAPERARWFYQELTKNLGSIPASDKGGKSYLCKGHVIVIPNANSNFQAVWANPVTLIVKTVNALAPVAKKPTLELPQ